MAFLLELGELAAELAELGEVGAELGEAGAELGAEGAEIGAGVGEAGAVAEGGAAAVEYDAVAAQLAEQEGAAMAEGAGEFAEAEAGEAAELAKAEAGAADIEAIAPAGGRAANIWTSVKTFTKFVAVEAGKGALLYAGLKGAEKLIEEGKGLFKGGDAAAQQEALAAVKKMAEVVKKLKAVTDDHYKWTKSHFEKATSYGVLEIPGEHLKLLRYKLFVQKLAALDAQRNTVAKSLGAAIKAKDVKKILSILPALKDYADKAQEISHDIDAKETLMVNDGLKSHTSEVKEAVDIVNQIQV